MLYATILILFQYKISCGNIFSQYETNNITSANIESIMQKNYTTDEIINYNCTLNYFPNDFIFSNIMSLLFINLFGLLYSIYIEKINRQIYLRMFTSRKIIESNEFTTIVKNKIVYSILPPSIATEVLNGKYEINESFNKITVVYVKIVGLDLLFYYNKLNNTVSNDLYEEKPKNEDCINIVKTIFEELDLICDFYGMEKLFFNNDGEYVFCSSLQKSLVDNNTIFNACCAAIDIRNFIASFAKQINFEPLKTKIGIYSDELVINLKFTNGYRFEIFGKSIRMAKRFSFYTETNREIRIGKYCYRCSGAVMQRHNVAVLYWCNVAEAPA